MSGKVLKGFLLSSWDTLRIPEITANSKTLGLFDLTMIEHMEDDRSLQISPLESPASSVSIKVDHPKGRQVYKDLVER